MNDENMAMDPAYSLLEKCFREESADMVKFAARSLENYELAETVVQDCFVFALENIEKLKSRSNPVGWLYGVLKNFIKHAIRDRQKYLKHIAQEEDVLERSPLQYDQYSQGLLDDKEDRNLRLLVQFYIYGYSLKELAEYYHKDVGTIKMRLKRAREYMKERL